MITCMYKVIKTLEIVHLRAVYFKKYSTNLKEGRKKGIEQKTDKVNRKEKVKWYI